MASFDGEFVRFDSVRVNPKPVRDRRIPVVVGGNSECGYAPRVDMGRRLVRVQPRQRDAVADRVNYLRAQCAECGRDPGELRLAVALRELRPRDVAPLNMLSSSV